MGTSVTSPVHNAMGAPSTLTQAQGQEGLEGLAEFDTVRACEAVAQSRLRSRAYSSCSKAILHTVHFLQWIVRLSTMAHASKSTNGLWTAMPDS